MSWGRITAGSIVLLLISAATVDAQIPLGERPEVVKATKPLTREELQRRQADELFREAQALYGAGLLRGRSDRLLDALEALEKVVELDPEAVEPRRALIPMYLAVGRQAEALETSAKVLERDPADYETAFLRFKVLRSGGKPKEAVDSLQLAIKSKRAEGRPERLLIMLAELAGEQERAEDWIGAETSHRHIAQLFTQRRQALLATGEMQPEAIDSAVAQAYERAGNCCLRAKRYAEALAAYRLARDGFAQHPDGQVRMQANRLNWHLSEVCSAQENWGEALAYLDLYLQQHPAALEPYERKIALLRQLGRDGEIIPMVRKLAEQEPHHVGIQLLLGRELGKEPRSQREAEGLYLKLAERYANPEVYRGLFKLYRSTERMERVLDLLDETFKAAGDKDEERPAEQREAAADRGRAMLAVLRDDAGLAEALLPAAVSELQGGPRPRKRETQTWRLLGALAAKAHKLDEAEKLFRECLPLVRWNPQAAPEVYSGLLEVLWMAHKPEAVAELCRQSLTGPQKLPLANESFFHRQLALALSELDKPDEGLTEIDTAIKQASDDEKVADQTLRVRILSRAGRSREAIAECETMVKELTKATHIRAVRMELSQVYNELREHEKSEEQLRILLETEPNDALVCNNLGYQLADRNRDLDEAERLIRRALELDRLERKPGADDAERATYLDSLGWVLFRKRKLDEARDVLEKAAALSEGTDEPVIWDHLGDVYFKLNEPAKAKRAWESAVKLYEHDRRSKKEGRQDEARRKLKLLQTSAER
jgi:tetratricopeptide (TPR) repeat protein